MALKTSNSSNLEQLAGVNINVMCPSTIYRHAHKSVQLLYLKKVVANAYCEYLYHHSVVPCTWLCFLLQQCLQYQQRLQFQVCTLLYS